MPGDSRLNVNTASAEVLAALLPMVRRPAWDKLLAARSEAPFASLEEFVTRLGQAAGFDAAAEVDATRFGVGSDWFGATLTAVPGAQAAETLAPAAARWVVLERQPLPLAPRVAYRRAQTP